MECPKDVSQRVFRKMMADKPPAFDLVGSRREGGMRYFKFYANWKHGLCGRGDILEIPVACKFKRRSV